MEQKEEVNIQSEQKEETRIKKKMRRSLGTSNTAFKHSNIGIIEGEEEEQETEDLFEKTMKENFPNLPKEKDFQEV